jgi:hypothetical protein
MAARAIKVLEITTNADSSVTVRYTSGLDPLPSSPSGEMIFPSTAVLQQMIAAMAPALSDAQMLMFHLGTTWLKPNGDFGNISQVTNKTLLIDPTAPSPYKVQ